MTSASASTYTLEDFLRDFEREVREIADESRALSVAAREGEVDDSRVYAHAITVGAFLMKASLLLCAGDVSLAFVGSSALIAALDEWAIKRGIDLDRYTSVALAVSAATRKISQRASAGVNSKGGVA